MIGQAIHHYRVLAQLGAGGMGVVYEAEDTRLGRHVAIKVLPASAGTDREAVERFEREARIASSLNHPNICTIYDVGVHDGRPFLVMELIEGESLRGRIHGSPLPLEQILDVGCQVADALDAAHAQGIVHRDIKPANIYLTRRGQAKLLDFGIAKLSGDRHGSGADDTHVAHEALTTPGMAVGSVNYMSPEQARGEPLDARTDLFSLGLVIYEMITGRQAFAGQTTAVVFDAILNRPPADARAINPDAPDDLLRVISRALEKDRRVRFQTAADMLAELMRLRRDTGRTAATEALGAPTPSVGATAAASAGSPAPTSPADAATRATSAAPEAPGARRRLVAGLAGVAALAAAAAAYVYYGRAPAAPVLSERDTVLVADFANTTGDAVFDDALRQAVSVNLQQTPFLTLLPDLRIQRTLRLMQRPPDEPVVGQTAREACQRAGAKATVEGSIAALGTSYVVTLGVHNCQTGESLARAQGQADRKEDVLRALGTALTTLRTGLGESLASIAKYDVPVADATTTSLEALRLYGQGLRARAAKGDAASIPFFTQAAEKDPGFALAYAKLGVVMGNLGQADSARQFAQKAYDLRDKVSEYERLYINWNHASRVLADPVAVKEALELLTASYPRDFAARNNLGVYYNGRGQFEEALAQYQQAIAIAPDEPAPVANAAYVALALDRVEEAYGLMDRALAMRPDGGLAVARWQSAAMARDARAAEFEADAVKLATEEQVLTARASLALWFGQFKAYDRFVDDLRALARKAKRPDSVLSLDIGQTITRGAFLGGAHVDAMEGLLKTAAFPTVHAQVGAVLAMVGRVEPGRRLLPSLLKAAANNQGMRLQTTIVQAYVLAADGKPQEAVGLIEAAIAEVPRAQELYYHVGQIKERASDLAGAIAAYRTVVRARMSIGASPAVAAARIALGAALVKSGDAGGAEEQFATLRDQWRDADTDFPMLTVVRGKK